MRLALALALVLAGCSGGKDNLNEVELTKAANQLANDTEAAVNAQINAINETRVNKAEPARQDDANQ